MLDLVPRSVAGHLDVLGALPITQRRAILAQCEEKRFNKGDTIWNQGDPVRYIAFLIEGAVMSTHCSRDGKMGIVGIWFPGDILGFADLGGYQERQCALRCERNTRIFAMDIDVFYSTSSKFPELAQTVIRAMSARIRWISALTLSLATQTAYGRICTVLFALSEKFAIKGAEGLLLELKLTNEELASFVGVTRQFVNSVLKELEQEGLIVRRRRRIVIRDLAKIKALISPR